MWSAHPDVGFEGGADPLILERHNGARRDSSGDVRYLFRYRRRPCRSLAAYLTLVVRFAWNPTPFAQGLAAIGVAAALTYASFAYGLKHALALFLACTAITFAMENLGVATGFPFGHYHFQVAPGLPHIGAIPVVVGPLWFGMGYFSWTVAGILLGGADFRLRERFNNIVLPVVAT